MSFVLKFATTSIFQTITFIFSALFELLEVIKPGKDVVYGHVFFLKIPFLAIQVNVLELYP